MDANPGKGDDMGDKKNCWEIKKCGRETGGKNAVEFGVCPAAADKKFNGIHGGKNGGRCCWALVGTLCGGRVQGTFASKSLNCFHCEFYKLVKQEEGGTFLLTTVILDKIKE